MFCLLPDYKLRHLKLKVCSMLFLQFLSSLKFPRIPSFNIRLKSLEESYPRFECHKEPGIRYQTCNFRVWENQPSATWRSHLLIPALDKRLLSCESGFVYYFNCNSTDVVKKTVERSVRTEKSPISRNMKRSQALRILPFFTLTQTFHSKIAHFQLTTTGKKKRIFL